MDSGKREVFMSVELTFQQEVCIHSWIVVSWNHYKHVGDASIKAFGEDKKSIADILMCQKCVAHIKYQPDIN